LEDREERAEKLEGFKGRWQSRKDEEAIQTGM
jgi:hypothetical protein